MYSNRTEWLCYIRTTTTTSLFLSHVWLTIRIFLLHFQWGWTFGEIKALENLGGIFAADVVYDEDMASSFFQTAKSVLMLSKKPYATPLFLAMEKRYTFFLG